MSRIVVLVLAVFLLGGCLGPSAPTVTETPTPEHPWNLNVYIENIEPRTNGALHGSVAPGGIFDGGFHGVYVVFLDEDENHIKEVLIGNVTGIGRHHFNTTVPTLPVYMTVQIERMDLPQPRNGVVQGRYIDGDGETDLYRVEGYENYSRDVSS